MKDAASFSAIRYSFSINILKTECRYSKPFNKTDGFVSKNRNVNHFNIKSRFAIKAAPFSGKSSASDSNAFIWYLFKKKNKQTIICKSYRIKNDYLKSEWNILAIKFLLIFAFVICSFNNSTNSSLGVVKFHLSTFNLLSSSERWNFALLATSSGDVSTSSSFLRLIVCFAEVGAGCYKKICKNIRTNTYNFI